eukprot:GHVP01059144.1.p1 GENE.GHVP01059144.1~~GHVP01059144.1.p1  ORF type:complete len:147 (+),score=22.43 GHVP01059144.1:492-932(+)
MGNTFTSSVNSHTTEVPPEVITSTISPIEEDYTLNYNEVHLGTLHLSQDITKQSHQEATKRHMLSLSNEQKQEGYYMWLSTMLELKKIKPATLSEVHYFGPTTVFPLPAKESDTKAPPTYHLPVCKRKHPTPAGNQRHPLISTSHS